MSRAIRHVKPQYRDIVRMIESLTGSRSLWNVWSDMIEMIAISIANSVDHSPRSKGREEHYLRIAKGYTPKDMDVIARVFAEIVNQYEVCPDQDLLGEIHMSLNFGSDALGQVFTPYNVCKMMAEMTVGNDLGEKEIAEKGYFSANDPACGAGATLIALVNVLKERGLNYQQKVFIIAQDIERTAALMCYIQLSMLGCAAAIFIGDTIRYPATDNPTRLELADNVWLTPICYTPVWMRRREARLLAQMMGLSTDRVIPEKKEDKPVEIPKAVEMKPIQAEQLSLF